MVHTVLNATKTKHSTARNAFVYGNNFKIAQLHTKKTSFYHRIKIEFYMWISLLLAHAWSWLIYVYTDMHKFVCMQDYFEVETIMDKKYMNNQVAVLSCMYIMYTCTCILTDVCQIHQWWHGIYKKYMNNQVAALLCMYSMYTCMCILTHVCQIHQLMMTWLTQ